MNKYIYYQGFKIVNLQYCAFKLLTFVTETAAEEKNFHNNDKDTRLDLKTWNLDCLPIHWLGFSYKFYSRTVLSGFDE